MKKNNTSSRSPKRATARNEGPITIGMDLGDKTSRYCVLGAAGEVCSEGSVATTKKAMTQKFAGMRRGRVGIEVGTHSPWMSRLLTGLGFEVIVANARQVQLISASTRKNVWTHIYWHGWREWIQRCCVPSGTAASKRKRI